MATLNEQLKAAKATIEVYEEQARINEIQLKNETYKREEAEAKLRELEKEVNDLTELKVYLYAEGDSYREATSRLQGELASWKQTSAHQQDKYTALYNEREAKRARIRFNAAALGVLVGMTGALLGAWIGTLS